jgi:alcohol dehydrogenase
MNALIFDGKLKFAPDAPTPVPEEGEALVRVSLAGICSTDLEIIKGYMGFTGIPGHEFAGVVEAAENPAFVGKRVVGEINCPCRSCSMCSSGLTNHCPQRTVLGIKGRDGAFAEYLALPLENLHLLPEEMSDEQAVFVEPVAAAYEILEQTKISDRDRIVIVGDGRLAILCAQVLMTTGAELTVIGHHQEKLKILGNLGIDTLIESESGDLQRADVVIDCSGSSGGFARSRELVRPGGQLVLKSTFASSVQVDLSSLVVDEIHLIGSRCGPFLPAMSAIAKNEVIVSSMISAVYPMTEGVEAFERASSPGALKVLLTAS